MHNRQGRQVPERQPACRQLWGYEPAELIGRKYIEFVYGEDRPKTEEAAAFLLAQGTIPEFVNRYVRKDGEMVDVLWSASWSPANEIMFCVAHNVTERARIEKALHEAKNEAERANNAKSEFLSRMSHELRTPLNAILGFSQLLERQSPTPKQSVNLSYIVSAGRHLLDLINEVLDISRIEAGSMQLSVEPVPVAEALREALELMEPLARQRDITLQFPAETPEGCHVLADQQRLKQVLLNLLTNAVKYTPPGGQVTIWTGLGEAGRVRIEVRDNGPGIAADKLSRLFTPFDRLGAEQTDIEGTGLGLAVCQRLIQAMGGAIGVGSAPGQGSSFWLDLPRGELELPDALFRKSGEDSPPEERRGASACRILYIEDNLSNCSLVRQMFADQPGIDLSTARQGQAGIDLARQQQPDLILLDLHLPDLPGWEVLAHLKAEHTTRHIPVIIISADATSPQMKRLLNAGAQDYLTKPIDMHKLFQVVDETTRTASLTRKQRAEGAPAAAKQDMSAEKSKTTLWHRESVRLVKMKILIIDDEPLNVALLEALLSESGYTRVKAITDSRMALETIREYQPDLILLDLMMPVPDGFAIMEALRGPAGQSFLPIIVLTADATQETKRRALHAGATDFLLKPFDHLEVALRIANVLETRRLHLALDLRSAALEDAVLARTLEVREMQARLEKIGADSTP